VLFVCTANICRSPFMEQTARMLAGDATGVRFTSAGTQGLTDHAMDDVMAANLEQPDHAFRSRRLTRELIEQADLVLTAESTHRAFILDEFPQAVRRVFTLGQFAAYVEQLDGLRGRDLIAAAGERRTPADLSLDIADPYRRGNAASATAAGTISTMLSVIVPALVEET
jgi:protein-tyrosine-phosphatase